jgi:2,3-bisphosphoglycerate-dependent phosphoglycerate mutase
MTVRIVFETHSTTEDNENGIATGWLPGRLSEVGREQAAELGRRRVGDGIAAVFSSDLARATETVAIALGGTSLPVLLDWRLRECDYGALNSSPAASLHAHRAEYLDEPYPDGESWRQAVARVASFLADLPVRWSGQRILVVGHVATHWGLEHLLLGTPLEQLARRQFDWQPGWEYPAGRVLPARSAPGLADFRRPGPGAPPGPAQKREQRACRASGVMPRR